MDDIKILVIDDEDHVLKFIGDLLRKFNVTFIRSSYEAAQLIEQKHFDIYIVDYQMPGFNGIELLEQVKKNTKGKKYVAIFCTAYGTIHIFKEELTEGLFDYFIEKPFKVENFKTVFNQAIVKLGKIQNRSL